MKQATTCPCCGQPTATKTVIVDEGSGAISYNNRIGYLQPKQVDIMLALMNSWPSGLSDEDLIKAAWGRKQPDGAAKALAVHICIINRVVKGWGIEVLKGNGVRAIRYAWSRA
jgi:DNA-binding response OmpR family regulator